MARKLDQRSVEPIAPSASLALEEPSQAPGASSQHRDRRQWEVTRRVVYMQATGYGAMLVRAARSSFALRGNPDQR
jgi:hypothetical protein